MKNSKIDLAGISGITFRDDIVSYTYKKVFGVFDVKARINDYFIRKIDEKIIPWYANWCQPWPVNYIDRESFRGINGFLLRSNYCGFCPYWLPESYIEKQQITTRKGERPKEAISKEDDQISPSLSACRFHRANNRYSAYIWPLRGQGGGSCNWQAP